ncbi:MAG: alpha/beta fold hydrolase [Nitrospinae bacterium]|nr:alpha/beta fold hydrolase [Nitrospinota bacterium]
MALNLNDISNEYPFTPKRFDLGGVSMSYLDEGPPQAHTVVMLHGNPTWSFYYRKLVSALSGGYRVIVPDHIGCGLSDKPQDYDYTLKSRVEALTKLLEGLGIGRMSMAVHDWGGAIGMGYAVEHADKIASFVIFNTAAFVSQKIPGRIDLLRLPFIGEAAIRGLNVFALSAIKLRMATLKPERFTSEVTRGYLGPYDSWANRIAIARFVADIPMDHSHPSYRLLKSIGDRLHLFENTPSLLVWGKGDFCFDESFLAEWLKRLKNVEAHMFEDAGHYVVEDAHERIIPLMESFLERNR